MKNHKKRFISILLALFLCITTAFTCMNTPVTAYADDSADTSAAPVTIWANGTKSSKSATLKTTLSATNYTNASGKTQKGKLAWISKNEQTKIEFNESKHTITTKADKTIVAVSNKGVVQAKSAGTAYVYAIDTGSMKYEEFEIIVKSAPSKLTLTKTAGQTTKDALAKKIVVQVGETSDKLYINNHLKKEVVNMADLTYTVTVDSKSTGVITASEVQQDSNGYYITVSALKTLISGKVTKASLTVQNVESGKKVKLTVNVADSVKEVELSGSGELKGEDTEATYELKITTSGENDVTTDRLKVYVCEEEPTVNGSKVSAVTSNVVGAKFSDKTNELELSVKDPVTSQLGIYLVCTESASKAVSVIKVATIGTDGTVN